MKGITTCDSCLIELWESRCEDCRVAERFVIKLEKLGYPFEKYHIESPIGKSVLKEFSDDIDEYNEKFGYKKGQFYAPTFINRKTGEVLAFPNRHPTKEEILNLAKKGGE